nr:MULTISPECIES: aromatic-ring-hydroxylating dioxygenase subunit beta [unclassified Pseudomonas]
MINLQLLNQVTAFIWQEADMLDHGDFVDWLDLWTEDATYIIPIDPLETDFENTLNYAYDNHHMRQLRVTRLTSGESISTTPRARTVRSQSRFRLLADEGGVVTVRCAQNLREFRKDVLKQYTADVTFQLVRSGDSFKIQRKLIQLINSTDTLAGIGYIL